MQKILTLETSRPSLRCSVDGWGWEDGDLVIRDKEIGYSTAGPNPGGGYRTPMHAVADGWKLLAPPAREEHFNSQVTVVCWTWWLVKD